MGSDTTQHTPDYLDRMAGPAVCRRPRQRRVRSPKWWFGCQRILHNLCCWTRVSYISPRFHNHHAFLWVWRWWGRVHTGGKFTEPSHCQTGESLRKSARGLSGSTHTYPSPGFLTLTARALAEGSQRALQRVQTCVSRLLLSWAPTFCSQLPWCCLRNPPQTTYTLPLAQVVFQGPHKPGISLSKITLRPCECVGDIFSGLSRLHFSLHLWLLFRQSHILHPLLGYQESWLHSQFQEWVWFVRVILLIGSGGVRLQLGPVRPKRYLLLLLQK